MRLILALSLSICGFGLAHESADDATLDELQREREEARPEPPPAADPDAPSHAPR